MSRGVETSVEAGVKKNNVNKCSCREGVEVPSKDTRKEARSIHQLSKSYRGSRNFLDQPHSYRKGVEIAIINNLRSRQIAKCRGGIEKLSRLLKNSFSKGEKHRYEWNQACNSTKDPINILNSQNHLLTAILAQRSQKHTHTHTLNKSNQFYISKIS